MVIGVLGFGELPHCELDWWCFMGYPVQVGGFPSYPWVVGCSYSGVYTEGVEVKIPFDKRPKTRVQGVGFYALCGDVVPLFLLQVRFCRGGGVRGVGVGCLVTLVSSSQTGFTYYGRGAGVMPQLVLGAVGYWLMTGSVGDEGESGSLVTLSLWSCAG